MREGSLFTDDEKQELGIESSSAVTEPEEGQENKPVVTPVAEAEKPTEGKTEEGTEQATTEESTAETEKQTEEESQTTKEEKTEVKEEPVFDVGGFNKFFGKEFKDENEIKGLFEKVEKSSDYDEKVTKISEYENTLKEKDERIKALEESLDPLSYFDSEASYKATQIKKQMPGKDPVLIEKVITSDLSKVSDFELLVDEFLLDNPGFGGDRTRAANVLIKKHGIDPEEKPEEWDSVTKDELMVDANRARERFKGLADKVELPTVVKPEDRAAAQAQQEEELKTSWKEPIGRISEYKEETIKDDDGNVMLKFTVPDDFKSSIGKEVEAMVTSSGIPVNEDSLKFIEATIRKEMIFQNLPKILKVYGSDLESQWQKKKDEEEGNATPPNKQTAPENMSEEGKQQGLEKMLDDLENASHEGYA